MNRRRYLLATEGLATTVLWRSSAAADDCPDDAAKSETLTFLEPVGGGRSRALHRSEDEPTSSSRSDRRRS